MLCCQRITRLCFALFAAAACWGCGSNSGLEIHPAEGSVSFSGQPLAGATVVFTPASKSEEAQKDAQAETDENGEFAIKTFDGKKYHAGVASGDYIVTITKLELPKDMRGQPKHLLPKQYRSASTSPLKASVSADSETRFDFQLEK